MAGLIPKHFIDKVLANTDIVDIINSRVPLKKQGREFTACCPFHSEKTPSFTVSPTKQFYHCFGCGAHGSAISFLMDYERLDFVEAIEVLADSLGMEVEHEDDHTPQRKSEDTTPLFNAMEAARRFFQQSLKNAPKAIDYLQKRGINGETAKAFQIGYAPDGWQNLLSNLEQQYSHETLNKAGLLSRNDSGRTYDKFRDRIMFPIRNPRGRTIAFGGRILDQGEPKYLNSPETPIFHKSEVLYGLYEARQQPGKLDHFIVVEGYMDVIALAQYGIHNVVATLGTATTQEHLTKLFRQAARITFCFDGDKAGRKAAWRALTTALSTVRDGKRADFLFLPEGEDPDTLLRTQGTEAFLRLLDQSQPLSEFLLAQLKERHELDSMEGRSELGRSAQDLLKNMHEGLLKTQLLEAIGDLTRLGKSLLGKGLPVVDKPRAPLKKSINRQQRIEVTPMRLAISALLQNPSLASRLQAEEIEQIKSQPGGKLLLEIHHLLLQNPELHTGMILEQLRGHPHQAQLSALSVWQPPLMEESGWESLLIDAIQNLRKKQREQRVMDLLQKSTLAPEEKAELRRLTTQTASQ